ncbi:MAG: hypothetical protein C4334_05990 [Pyrinomonas sp.]|uniref:VanZ family protein n=1 Tax=Pyrinomonas sp. TaxID=2080306 RepID=UPI00331AB4E9
MVDDRNKQRLWRYGPLLAWMALIFFASSGEFSAANTSRIIRPLLLWLFPEISEQALNAVHALIRKGAHFGEYAVLALLAARAFLSSSRALLCRHWLKISLLLVISYALFDEYRQSFVPTRTPSLWDSLIDIAGGASALLLIAAWRARKDGARWRSVRSERAVKSALDRT